MGLVFYVGKSKSNRNIALAKRVDDKAWGHPFGVDQRAQYYKHRGFWAEVCGRLRRPRVKRKSPYSEDIKGFCMFMPLENGYGGGLCESKLPMNFQCPYESAYMRTLGLVDNHIRMEGEGDERDAWIKWHGDSLFMKLYFGGEEMKKIKGLEVEGFDHYVLSPQTVNRVIQPLDMKNREGLIDYLIQNENLFDRALYGVPRLSKKRNSFGDISTIRDRIRIKD